MRDQRNEANDKMIATHVIGMHMMGNQQTGQVREGEIDIDTLKKYITYARMKIRPVLSEDAAMML